jgi:hypothetical protein
MSRVGATMGHPKGVQAMRVEYLFPLLLASLVAVSSCGGASIANGSSERQTVRGETVEMWVTSDGEPLPIFNVDGLNYLLGQRGQQYDIWLTNRTDERLEAVVSVDGRDVITGREADYVEDRGYILYPGEELQIEGFRTSLDSVAAFEFSDVSDSYAARMGDASNVGVIGIALFEEAERGEPVPIAGGGEYEGDDEHYPPPSAAPSAEAKAAPSAGASADIAMEEESQGLGTKYGDQVGSEAEIVPFKRKDPDRPLELIGLYYDDRRGLEAKGVEFPDDMKYHALDPDGPNPFPGSRDDGDYAPPPPPVY